MPFTKTKSMFFVARGHVFTTPLCCLVFLLFDSIHELNRLVYNCIKDVGFFSEY